jgi:hypothetical protein
MESEHDFTLRFLRSDGRREQAKLSHQDLAQARELAERVFHIGGDLYSEVEIWRDGLHLETIKNRKGGSARSQAAN